MKCWWFFVVGLFLFLCISFCCDRRWCIVFCVRGIVGVILCFWVVVIIIVIVNVG